MQLGDDSFPQYIPFRWYRKQGAEHQKISSYMKQQLHESKLNIISFEFIGTPSDYYF